MREKYNSDEFPCTVCFFWSAGANLCNISHDQSSLWLPEKTDKDKAKDADEL